MSDSSADKLPLGTTPPYARMHKWLQRGLLVCLAALVLEGAFTFPLFGPPEGAGQTAARQDVWGVQPQPLYKRVEFGEFITRRDERLARQAAAE